MMEPQGDFREEFIRIADVDPKHREIAQDILDYKLILHDGDVRKRFEEISDAEIDTMVARFAALPDEQERIQSLRELMTGLVGVARECQTVAKALLVVASKNDIANEQLHRIGPVQGADRIRRDPPNQN